jgi:TfoX/Sxy family transcriptional regulator of competence genes
MNNWPRIRKYFIDYPIVEEKAMMGGLTFILNGKMCVGIIKDDLMCRIDPAEYDRALEQPGCRQMDFTGKPMKGYILVDDSGMHNKKDFVRWMSMAVAFNKHTKAAKKKNSVRFIA